MPDPAVHPASRPRTLHLVDASIYVFRAWHSLPNEFHDADGWPTNAVHGFARFLLELLEQERPQHIAIAFDEALDSCFRNQLYPAYKANRESPPQDLARQFVLCREFCRHLGLAEFAHDEYEADDIIGTLASRARASGLASVLVTRDKDLSQLVRDGDVFWDYSANARYHYHDIGPRFGVSPERIADFLALTGDAVDNIPGVPGIGRKTACELFAVFESLDHLYADLDRVAALKLRGAAGVAAKLRAHKEAAYLARRLTGIVCDIPMDATLDDLKRRAPDRDSLEKFFDSQGFGRMLRTQAQRIAAAYPAA